MTSTIGLDFETYGAVDLPTHGLARYVQDETFLPLIACIKHDNSHMDSTFDFVVNNADRARSQLALSIRDSIVVGHNVGFEYAVLKWLNLENEPADYRDSAVNSRAAGGSGSLAMASRQLMPTFKMEEGVDLMRLFSMPGPYQDGALGRGKMHFDKQVVYDNPGKWELYKKYCMQDALLSRGLEENYPLSLREVYAARTTFEMNQTGWTVDREIVEEMYARYLENQARALEKFIVDKDAKDFNVNSYPQLKRWCAERGIKANSFDEKHVAKLLALLDKKVLSIPDTDPRLHDYMDVIDLLMLKQVLGGSSLKKLKVILDTIVKEGEVWKLKDQYLHVGAGQTWRTTGRSVQMQNLKRLDSSNIADMAELVALDVEWDNPRLAENIRQTFTSRYPAGALIVGDFASVESRGLAYMAGEDWKISAFKSGADVYKELATQIYGVPYGKVTKDQRQVGKVGELSCGYQAGADAVKGFASNMGVEFNDAEAAKLVNDWRAANPRIVEFWARLEEALQQVMNGQIWHVTLPDGIILRFDTEDAPASLQKQLPRVKTLVVSMRTHTGATYFVRYFHGLHRAGSRLRYFKPSKKKTGDAWSNQYVDPKTKQVRFFEIYGGKMAGILTQSFCREIFMDQLVEVNQWVKGNSNLELPGQFHDEIVVDWVPGGPATFSLHEAERELKQLMSRNVTFPGFPLAAEVHSAYRYIK